MKKLLTSLLLMALCHASFSQIRYEIELLPDNETYLISFLPSVTYNPPGNKIVSGQVTIKAPHGIGANAFSVANLKMETIGAIWQNNDIVRAPFEAPSWDYFSFAMTTPGSDAYNFQAGVKIPVFSFKNGGEHCADSVYIIDNMTDPFIGNSSNIDISNTIALLAGGGPNNLYDGPVGSGAAPGTPATLCTDLTLDERIACDSVFYQGRFFLQDTVFDLHYTSSIGCDSIIQTEIRIEDELAATVDTVICEGDVFKGNTILQDATVTQTYTSTQGCDSIVTYLVRVAFPSSWEGYLTVLPGQVVSGVQVFSDTTIVAMLTNAAGCDSTATTHVTVYNVPTTPVNADICLGQSYNGAFYLHDTSFVEILTGAGGFDSIIVHNLQVHENYYINFFANLCLGQAHTDGVVYQADTTFSQNLLTVHGCDSVITSIIEVVVPVFQSTDTTICFGSQYQGVVYEQDQVFEQAIVSANGCDSIVTRVNLFVTPPVNAIISGLTAICQGEETVLTATGGDQYFWSNGLATEQITVASAGGYQVTVSTATGCSGVASVTVFESDIEAQLEAMQPGCETGPSGAIEISNTQGGMEPYLYSMDGGNSFSTEPSFANLSAGSYTVLIQDQTGCQWTESATIEASHAITLDAGAGQEIRLGETVVLQASTNILAAVSIIWSPQAGLSCPTCLETEAMPHKTTTYTIVLTDEKGCTAESSVTIKVRPQHEVYVPNAFSPNDDGFNDSFTVFADNNVSRVRRLAVFERWGGQVFVLENFQPNDLTAGWKGTWRDVQAPEGLYIWLAEVEFIDGKTVLFEGEVNLMR